MGELGESGVAWNKPSTEKNTSWPYLHVECKKKKVDLMEVESRIVIISSWIDRRENIKTLKKYYKILVR
jgi:hypothetical protein